MTVSVVGECLGVTGTGNRFAGRIVLHVKADLLHKLVATGVGDEVPIGFEQLFLAVFLAGRS